jgi:hypothetical protein
MAITVNGSNTPVTADSTTTFTNKTLTAPIISDPTITGTTTNINTTNLVVEDKNIVINDVTSPSDANADGGGISLNGTTTKTLNWVDSTDAWTSSEHLNLAAGKSYYVGGTLLKDVSETLTNKTLTSPVITGAIFNDGSVVFEGTTADAFETTLAITDPTADRTITFPDSTGTVALTSGVINNTLTSATGDMIYASSANTPARLAIGTAGQTLVVSAGGIPEWGTAASGGVEANDQAFAFAVQVFA